MIAKEEVFCVGCEHLVPEDIDVFELICGKYICRDCIEWALVSPVHRDAHEIAPPGVLGAGEVVFVHTTGGGDKVLDPRGYPYDPKTPNSA